MERYYIVKLDTNAPEHKLPQLDQTFVKEVKLQFGSSATVYWLPPEQVPHTYLLKLNHDG